MKELQQKNDAELIKYIGEQREELRKLRFGGVGSTRNTHTIRTLRHEIARALTELNGRNKVTHEA